MISTQIRMTLSRLASVLLLTISVAGFSALFAQSPTSPQDAALAGLERLSFGGRLSILATDTMNSDRFHSSTSQPPVKTTVAASSTSSYYGGGATVEFAFTRRLALGADLLLRKAGYKIGSDVLKGVDDGATPEDERLITSRLEQTRANYWDVPVLLKLYNGDDQRSTRGFLEAGIAFRFARNISSITEISKPDGSGELDRTSASAANDTITGIALGGGFQVVNRVGIKVTPQVRYTRWRNDTFNNPPVTRSRRNQFEVLIGLTF